MKIKRKYITDPKLNILEHEWWNKNADIVSRVWEMNSEISWAIRRQYLDLAKEYFLKDATNVTILELGCGSGWVGQFIAGPNFKIIGTDFSQKQIELAINNAKLKGLDAYCDYAVSDSEIPNDIALKVDGVLIHAFMHHLNGKEIDDLLSNLKSSLKTGSKIFIYEPSFYLAAPEEESRITFITSLCMIFLNYVLIVLNLIYKKFNLTDLESEENFAKLAAKASSEGWYLSPKEIPFDLDDYSDTLKKYFTIKNDYWATIYAIGWVYNTNLIKNRAIRSLMCKLLLPFIRFTDHRLTKEKSFLEKTIRPPSYAFHVWECVV